MLFAGAPVMAALAKDNIEIIRAVLKHRQNGGAEPGEIAKQ
jgi:hypothetical protein